MKTLIAYFSWSNNTKKLVDKINEKKKYDVIRIERAIPYSDDYDICAYKEAKEEVNKKIHPAIKPLDIDFGNYDQILLFFPIWWYTFPMPIATFIESIKGYKGKVYIFANSYTNDPQYMINSMKDLRKIDQNIEFKEGLFNKSEEEHIQFIESEEI
ncbi:MULTISPECIES: flavodoxin [Erysipelotrichaceae]|nr:flavodoxin [Faecalitalea cylindroides]MBM6653535.1 hypothetical protein [Faecalitalea cylindroides]MDB7947563.1 flavodoxin [Faecalitalea cylindroides]MDB7949431.1 flavodoxin [Faecalitalea cylindroides]MDB7951297.1 flavodoxin [Faecalitalea cylindroides]MDC0827239.1 flavodoxin [Faecalitalea cylindroides]